MPSSVVCVDASVVVRLVTARDEQAPVVGRWRQWLDDQAIIAAPTLLFYEVANALHRYRVAALFDSEDVFATLDAALTLGVVLHGSAAIHKKALQLAQDLALPAAYDAHYLAVASQLEAPLFTSDRHLVNAVSPHLGNVHYVPG